jgi:hypothetical protein
LRNIVRHGITPTPSDGPAFASPSKPGSRHTVSQAPQSPHHFPKVDTSLFPQPYPGRDNTSLNLLTASPPSLLRSPPTPHAKSKRKQEEASAVLSNFGPATKNVISAHNLAHIIPMLTLIVHHNPAPLWGTMIRGLAISDDDHQILLEVLAADWMMAE